MDRLCLVVDLEVNVGDVESIIERLTRLKRFGLLDDCDETALSDAINLLQEIVDNCSSDDFD